MRGKEIRRNLVEKNLHKNKQKKKIQFKANIPICFGVDACVSVCGLKMRKKIENDI